MIPDVAAMHRLSLRFEDAALEAAYVEEQERKAARPRRMGALVAGACVSVVWALAFLRVQPLPLDLDRVSVLSIAFLVAATLFYVFEGSRHFLRYRLALNLTFFLLVSAFLMGGISLLPPASLVISGLAWVIVHTFSIYGIFRLRFPVATAGGWFTAAMYLGFLLVTDALANHDLIRHAFWLAAANVFGMFMGYQLDLYARGEFAALRALGVERERSERLLLNILPASIAARLKASDAAIADHSDEVTVLFADIVGFTPLSARKTPHALVQLLDRVFTEFDALAEMHGLEKIKTIGDAYMAVAGLPERRADHAQAAARMAQGMLEAVARIAAETGEALSVRVGLHSGPVVAGVIGRKKFIYDLWGDTVNTASRMESHGVPGAVHCSAETAALLQPGFRLDARGALQVEGKGEMHTFLLAPAGVAAETAKGGGL
jgi:class 3 adenylate cyclase